jgi:hypothetical protein
MVSAGQPEGPLTDMVGLPIIAMDGSSSPAMPTGASGWVGRAVLGMRLVPEGHRLSPQRHPTPEQSGSATPQRDGMQLGYD